MEKSCRECGYVNRAARGSELETCPKCGKWYANPPRSAVRSAGSGQTSRRRLIAWGVLIALAIAGWIAVQEPPPARGTGPVAGYEPPRAAPRMRSVEYSIVGTAPTVRVTYRNATGGQDQIEVTLPWHLTFNAARGTMLTISAQSLSSYGQFEVKIEADGTALQTAHGSGEYAVAIATAQL